MPAGMALAPHAGGRRSRPAQWSTPAGSPVEGAANFDSPPLPSRTAPGRRRGLLSVQASMGPIDGSHLELLQVALGLVFNSWPMQAEA